MSKTVLILGGSGRFGRHATTAFENRGWNVRQFDRTQENLRDATQGVDVIVNAWNPAYPDWAKQVPKLTAQVIEVAKATGATVIVPGNVYNFGVEAPAIYDANTPHHATNPLGRIRIEMEAAYRASGVRTIILRAGDFIDTQASGNWFDMMMIPKLGKGRFIYPGNPDVAHAWAWLPDLTRAAAELAEIRADLPVFADIPFAGYTLTGNELCTAISARLGRPIKLKKMSWLPLQIARPFWPMARHLLEMRYQWNKPHQIDGAKFDALLPDFKTTLLAQALPLAIGQHT
ncbi:MAG: sugar nucleotide-binding protein [Marinosulfonomonas sp.]|nr:sugar nucleotide-binding protein [Marinosulfonomonas sp.]